MTQSQTVTWPLLGSGDYVRRTLREVQMGTPSTLDLLVAAVTLGEKTWTQLACLLSAEWDEDKLNEALKFVGSYMKCASADGVIDVASIVTILTASDRADAIGAHNIAHDPRMTLPVSAVIRRNWDDVVRFGNDRSGNVLLSMAFRTVPIPADKAALIVHFSQALVEHNGGTRNTIDRGLYEMCLKCVGLDARAQSPQPFVALVQKGRAAIESGRKDPVSTHFSQHSVNYAPPPPPPEPAPETPAPPRATAAVSQPPVDWEEEARIAEAARSRREAAAEEARLADEASRAEATEPVKEDASAAVVEEDDGQQTMLLSELEIVVYKSVRMGLRILKEEKGYPCDRLSTRFLYRFVDIALRHGASGSIVIERMADKGAFTRLTPAQKSKPSIFAVNERRFKHSSHTKMEPYETTEMDVRRIIEERYSNVHILALDVAFVTSLPEDARAVSHVAPPIAPAVRKDNKKSATVDVVIVSERTLAAVEAMIGLGEYLVAEHDWPSAVHLVTDIVLAVNDRAYAFKPKGRSAPANSMKHRGLLRPAGQIGQKQFLWELTRKTITCVRKGLPPVEPVDASQYAAILREAFGEKLERLDAVRSAVRAHLALPAQDTVPTGDLSPAHIAQIEKLLKEFGKVSLRLLKRIERLERAIASKP